MTPEEIHHKLKSKFGDNVLDLLAAPAKGDIFIQVKPEKIRPILRHLKEESSFAFDNPLCISGVDTADRIEIIYHLHSYAHLHKVIVKTAIPDRVKPSIDSVSELWKWANWLEREIFDMFGVHFNDHPDLRRILCPDDWEGYPLRKDYVHQEFYHDMKVGM